MNKIKIKAKPSHVTFKLSANPIVLFSLQTRQWDR